jgi:Protein of unknown function (DUF3987)/Bifunctional DNA primase/polymerase, N-terminal/Primase C terminal 2 (PriCT-2)
MPDDRRSDEQIKRETVDPWRGAHPAIRKFWNGIEALFKTCVRSGRPATCGRIAAEMVDGALRLKLPSGRYLAYRDAHLGPGKFEGSTDLHFHNGYQTDQAWFGTIVENIVQGVARDLLAAAMLRLEAAGFPVVLHCHDEAVCEVPEDQADEARFLGLMTAPPDWAEGLPIAAKVWTNKRYGKSKAKANGPCADAAAEPSATGGEPAGYSTEPGADGLPQTIIPGCERVGVLAAVADKAQPITQKNIDEINVGLRREGIEPLTFSTTPKNSQPPADIVRDAALALVGRFGWSIFPANGKKSYKSAEYSSGAAWGKTSDPDQICIDFRRWPRAGVGVPTGSDNAIFVVEIDTPEGHGVDGAAALAALEAEHGALPETLTAVSPSGSVHRYFKHPGNGSKITSSTSMIGAGIDVKGDGGMVLAPPTIRPGKGAYRWLSEGAPIAEPPPWLLALVGGEANGPAPNHDGDGFDQVFEPAHVELAKLALRAINPDIDRDAWFEIGCALFTEYGEGGFELWNEWSSDGLKGIKSAKYPGAAAMDTQWRSILKGRYTYTLGTLFHYADEAAPGWRNADATPADDVSPIVDSAGNPAGDPGKAAADDHPGVPAGDPVGDAKQTNPTFETDPVDLWGKFAPPPLPIGLLPAAIEQFAFQQGVLMGADPAGLALSALTVCAAAIPARVKLKVKRFDGWMECACIWVALVADPSGMKTPIMRTATRPLIRIDNEMVRANAAARAEYDALPADEKKNREKPTQPRLRIEDTTIEAAQEVLRDSPDGVLSYQDELGGWFGSMDKYAGPRGAMKDRGFWNQAFNGGSYSVNRISRPSFLIENLLISILGGIQPDAIRKVAEDTVDDGLIQRIIPVMLRSATVGRDEPLAQAVEEYADLIGRLHCVAPPPEDLRFDAGALEIRARMEQWSLDLMGTFESFNRKFATHLGKYHGLFSRLCLIWHCVEHSGGKLPAYVTKDTADRVEKFFRAFLLPHALAFYSSVYGLSDNHDHLAAIAGYILARRLGMITNRDIQRGDRTMRGLDKQATDRVFHQLSSLGWVKQIPGARFTDPPRWTVNPEVHHLFAERGTKEVERRRRAREVVSEILDRIKATGKG